MLTGYFLVVHLSIYHKGLKLIELKIQHKRAVHTPYKIGESLKRGLCFSYLSSGFSNLVNLGDHT